MEREKKRGKKTLESNGVFCRVFLLFFIFILNTIFALFRTESPVSATPCETLFCFNNNAGIHCVHGVTSYGAILTVV